MHQYHIQGMAFDSLKSNVPCEVEVWPSCPKSISQESLALAISGAPHATSDHHKYPTHGDAPSACLANHAVTVLQIDPSALCAFTYPPSLSYSRSGSRLWYPKIRCLENGVSTRGFEGCHTTRTRKRDPKIKLEGELESEGGYVDAQSAGHTICGRRHIRLCTLWVSGCAKTVVCPPLSAAKAPSLHTHTT